MARRRWVLAFGLQASIVLALGCDGPKVMDVGDDDTVAGDDDTVDHGLREDEFEQRVAAATDVLFVVDNSCSMEEEQNALQSNFYNFIQFFYGSGLDYHIGITVLDDWQGQPPLGQLFGNTPYIDTTTPDPIDTFTANMTMGAAGMGACEVGLEASYRAITEPLVSGYNSGFYREDALLNVVIVSDEVDGSVTGCDAISWMDYVAWLTGLKLLGADGIYFAAIAGDMPSGCSSNWGDADPGRGYYEVYDALGPDHATFYSICEQDWSDVMVELGVRAAGLQLQFLLSEPAIPETVRVFIDPDGDEGAEVEFEIFEDHTFTGEYSFRFDRDENTLVFVPATVPPPHAILRVTYQIEI